jgi:hypothetical protein
MHLLQILHCARGGEGDERRKTAEHSVPECRVGTLEAGTEEIEGVGEKGGSGAGRESGDGVLITHHRTLG